MNAGTTLTSVTVMVSVCAAGGGTPLLAPRVTRYGPTPLGVDWTCKATQELRFVQLLKLCDFSTPFSLNDVGCGYGALLTYLARRHAEADIEYMGVDLSPAMIQCAKRLHSRRRHAAFVVAAASPHPANYSVASGIFNVKLHQSVHRWERFIAQTLIDMHATSQNGFAVNFMASRAPGQTCEPELYRIAPEPWIEFCERELGTEVVLLTDYGLREFTILARR